MQLRDAVKQMTPPALVRAARRIRGDRPSSAYGLAGDYPSWDEALAASTGLR